MKKFKVTNEMYKNGNVVEASRDNYAGDYVTAESEAEAIELYKDFLIEQIRNNNLNAEIIDDEIVVTDDDEIEIERFINFFYSIYHTYHICTPYKLPLGLCRTSQDNHLHRPVSLRSP